MADRYYIGQASRDVLQSTIRTVRARRHEYVPQRRRRVKSGGRNKGLDHFQLIRGSTLLAVDIADQAFQIEAVKEFEEHAKVPDSPTWVAAPAGGVSLGMGDLVWAAYHKDYITFDTGYEVVPVDWVMIPTSEAASTPPLRRFELTADKFAADLVALGMFLDHDGTMVGEQVALYDPGLRYYGKSEGYIEYQRGFQGYALLRADLADYDADAPRWEIISMEQFARWIILERQEPESPEVPWWKLIEWSGDEEWQFRQPVPIDPFFEPQLSDPAGILPGSPAQGDIIICELDNPDTAPPTYQVRVVQQTSQDRLVASGPLDTVPGTLLQKFTPLQTYTGVEGQRLVNFQEFDDNGTRKMRGWMDVSDLGGGIGTLVQMIPVLIRKEIPGAVKVSNGPVIRPTLIDAVQQTIETMELNPSGDLVPTGTFIDAVYRNSATIPAPATGNAWSGEVLQIGSTNILLYAYCKEWSEEE